MEPNKPLGAQTLKAVFFDLDNTLVLFDENAFYARYFPRISKAFAELFSPDEFREKLIRATLALRRKDGSLSNAEFFMNRFAEGLDADKTLLWKRFLTFYATEYDKIPVDYRVAPGAQSVVEGALRRGLKVVVASNPIFPESVQRKRVAWAGLEQIRFSLVTHIENMSYVKPRTEYYAQICRKIGEAPEACLMVGNDPVNDMAAAKIGIQTYLTEDGDEVDYTSLTDGTPGMQDTPRPDFQGSLAGVASVIETLS
jgi:FMN phosphatase YigB (HAD superfamily)